METLLKAEELEAFRLLYKLVERGWEAGEGDCTITTWLYVIIKEEQRTEECKVGLILEAYEHYKKIRAQGSSQLDAFEEAKELITKVLAADHYLEYIEEAIKYDREIERE